MIKTITKRSLIMLLVAWITFVSVFSAYQQTTEAAEYIAGAVAAIGGAPLLTALLIGGVVVAGGIALYEFSQTDAEDYSNFATGIKNGFTEFVSDQEKQIALEQDQSLTDQEAADIGVANARDIVNGFWSGAVDTAKSTTQNITFNAAKYWDLYSRIINDVSDNGIDDNGPIGIGTVLNQNALPDYDITSWTQYTSQISTKVDQYNTIIEIDGKSYCKGGRFFTSNILGQQSSGEIINFDNVIPFIGITFTTNGATMALYRYSTTTHTVSGLRSSRTYYVDTYDPNSTRARMSDMIRDVNASDFPVVYGDLVYSGQNSSNEEVANNIVKYLAIGGATVAAPIWKRTINNALNNTSIGQSIKTGRRQLVNNGDWVGSIFKEDSVPIKKTGINVLDGVVSGNVGWDIPSARTWDDVFSGGKPYADVVGQTGAIGVPDHVVTGTKDDGRTVEYPDDATVQDTSDYPRETPDDPAIDNDKPQEIPDKPQQEVFEDQGGTFYPTMMDLTNIFPFCIPFDVIYIIEKFNQGQEEAPVITIPIVYPSAIQSAMGSSGYEVVIDFEDFIVLRNILRVFILLLFIAGLMKITRDLIRG